jgi:hypothetical protein
MQPGGPRLLEPLFAFGFRRAVDANFARLKSVIESDLPPSTSPG